MKRTSVLVVLALAVLALGGDASALDDRTYPGSNCVVWQGSAPTYWYSTIQNPSSSTIMKVDCPAGNSTSLSISDSYVWALDRSSATNVVCEIIQPVISAGVLGIYSSGTNQTSGSSANYQFFGETVSQQGGWLYWTCSIPIISGANKSALAVYDIKQI